jgi:hypothetical protein
LYRPDSTLPGKQLEDVVHLLGRRAKRRPCGDRTVCARIFAGS